MKRGEAALSVHVTVVIRALLVVPESGKPAIQLLRINKATHKCVLDEILRRRTIDGRYRREGDEDKGKSAAKLARHCRLSTLLGSRTGELRKSRRSSLALPIKPP
jgi:hypothetical protein